MICNNTKPEKKIVLDTLNEFDETMYHYEESTFDQENSPLQDTLSQQEYKEMEIDSLFAY